jgi:hypothetical protein
MATWPGLAAALARIVPAWAVRAWAVRAWAVRAWAVRAWAVRAREVRAKAVPARGMLARGMLAWGVLACGVLAGCTPPPPLEARLQPWIGRAEADLVAAFGVPARTYLTDGLKFLQFEERRTQIVPVADPFYQPFGRFGPLGPVTFPATVVIGCDLTFALRQGVVESFTFRGAGCR